MSGQSKFEVLVVERDPAFLQLLKIFVSNCGFTPTSVSTANAAMDLFEKNSDRFALVISNVIMPESDGWTLAQCLIASNPDVKVILTSGESLIELTRQHQLQVPEEIFLRKPFGLESLKKTIARVMAEN